ncbi:tRNA pseudouridine(55) synthase TruB [Mechercharimyces sp. CAU 1602]|uniref:tRNA pseudouridine(55) synthase TruB n=1 Tax=Mechercharimyces sp. CAU 1602 TaxID=2973933 RepID=UPI002161A0A5|nr:tRNA pseudouridine(55) synthase TruB [Mechercharimyces sp. CAU 1602]MCS1351273.1 tRNA pseudouridine(55) synthase TruB [Mechercharimyces sp. CAU 1602]
MKHGVIPVIKPSGMTSHDVVAVVRRLAGQKRVGHTGTLDPDVVGILPICLGQATRIVEYIQDLPKRYRGTLVIGKATDTQDASGEVIAEQKVPPLAAAQIEELFHHFTGEIEQIPPMYSAVKVNGKRLYELARAGEEVERKPRKATIYELTMHGLEQGSEQCIIHFDVLCSRGTYVRTLCVDMGAHLGYPAHMSHLERVESGPLRIEDGITLAQLEEVAVAGEWADVLLSPDQLLGHFPSLIVAEADQMDVLNGLSLFSDDPMDTYHPLYRVYSENGNFCGIYRWIDEHMAKPEKVFRDG